MISDPVVSFVFMSIVVTIVVITWRRTKEAFMKGYSDE